MRSGIKYSRKTSFPSAILKSIRERLSPRSAKRTGLCS